MLHSKCRTILRPPLAPVIEARGRNRRGAFGDLWREHRALAVSDDENTVGIDIRHPAQQRDGSDPILQGLLLDGKTCRVDRHDIRMQVCSFIIAQHHDATGRETLGEICEWMIGSDTFVLV